MEKSEIKIYNTPDGKTSIEVKLEKETIKILGNTLEYKKLTNDESKGLLKIISDDSYALEILDQYDYQSLKIENTSGKEVYQLTYGEAIEQIQLDKDYLSKWSAQLGIIELLKEAFSECNTNL